MTSAACRLTACGVRRAACGVRRAACGVRRAACGVRRAAMISGGTQTGWLACRRDGRPCAPYGAWAHGTGERRYKGGGTVTVFWTGVVRNRGARLVLSGCGLARRTARRWGDGLLRAGRWRAVRRARRQCWRAVRRVTGQVEAPRRSRVRSGTRGGARRTAPRCRSTE
ncbi:hypothetical protein B1H18_21270 [Streptomyces tsukubensis]|uniref:Uncharacterized protein n=1 Tax=Streptomyces tsukubensis TaxID=83656 RepID=A0A1V4A621_9ACTN|nr:hypothetical protein B1H18_21270 [Streptomyces tsukubensis]